MRGALRMTGRFSSLTAYMAKTLTVIFGIILVLLGLLGFVSNPLIGMNALFVANVLHNGIHLVLGGILLAVAFWTHRSLLCLKVIGVVVFLLGLTGLLTVSSVGGILLGVIATNGASNWLHLIVGAVMFLTGMYSADDMGDGAPPLSPARPPSAERVM